MRLIDADELKNSLSDKDIITWTHEYGDAIPLDWIMSRIDNAPTVEPKQGEWVEFEGGYRCSNCDDIEVYIPNFCPNCGAKMKGGAE